MSDDATTYEFHNPQTLLGVANRPELQADEKPLYARNDGGEPAGMMHTTDGENLSLTELDGHKLIYNPDTGQVFNAVTSEYEIINPGQFIGPLVEELNDRDRTDVSGKLWVRNGGANVYAQVLFDETHSIHLPNRGRSNPVKCGFSLRWSHDGGISVRARGFAQDTKCRNSIRQVTSPVHVKHSGDVDERVDWRSEWQSVLDELGAFSEALSGIIEEAMSHTFFDLRDDIDSRWLDVTEPQDTIEGVDLPGPITERDRDGVYAFYELLGLPKYLGVSATDRLMWRAAQKDDPRVLSAWDAYSAATYALTHEGRGVPGASDDDKFRTVKDILMNPERAENEANREAMQRATPDEGQPSLAGELDDIEETTGEALRTYSERARQLEASFGGDD